MNGTVYKKGKRWYVATHYVDAAGKRRQKSHGGFATRREAEARKREVLHSIDKGTYVDPSRLTLGSYLTDSWLPSIRSTVRPSTFHSYAQNIRLHVIPELGGLHIQKLTTTRLNAFYAALLASGRKDGKEGGLSPKTVHYVHTILHKALKDAVHENLAATNPADHARPPKLSATKAREMETWSVEELRTFLLHVRDEPLYAAFVLAASTGMRRGEVMGLRWCDVDLEAAEVSIVNTLISVGHTAQVSDPKTSRGVRRIAIDRVTIDALRAHRLKQRSLHMALGLPHDPDGYVFTNEDGSAIHPTRLSELFHRHRRNAGLRHIRLHDIRHTHATLALKAGVGIKVISDRLGHASSAFTMDVYAHVSPAQQAEAAALVADVVWGTA